LFEDIVSNAKIIEYCIFQEGKKKVGQRLFKFLSFNLLAEADWNINKSQGSH
jgi:hypothetical protein